MSDEKTDVTFDALKNTNFSGKIVYFVGKRYCMGRLARRNKGAKKRKPH